MTIWANEYFKNKFGHKMYKASISLNVTCPNRDGKAGVGGCSFCSAMGSGEFASSSMSSVTKQIDSAINLVAHKVPKSTGYIAYFQSFTSTYCDASYLRDSIEEAMNHPMVEAIAIGTRPDCLGNEILDVLEAANSRMPLYVELGLQTKDDEVAKSFNRCYETSVYEKAVKDLKSVGINVITHVIFGLPGESNEMMLDTVRFVKKCGTDGIKFTCLYVLKNTIYEKLYDVGKIEVLEQDEYFDIVQKALNIIGDEIVVHRVTGDGPKSLLIAPMWTANKRTVVNYINSRFKR
ncbi:MAG: TIGR01212 family radical SAM protein [Saccharofermentans sp.]|nr:TIGR01212 family radical SAM protein [Saccharofermentans sp.]